jgi:hypothetical protein
MISSACVELGKKPKIWCNLGLMANIDYKFIPGVFLIKSGMGDMLKVPWG